MVSLAKKIVKLYIFVMYSTSNIYPIRRTAPREHKERATNIEPITGLQDNNLYEPVAFLELTGRAAHPSRDIRKPESSQPQVQAVSAPEAIILLAINTQ